MSADDDLRRLGPAFLVSIAVHLIAGSTLHGLGEAVRPPKPLAVRIAETPPEPPPEPPRPLPMAPEPPPRPVKPEAQAKPLPKPVPRPAAAPEIPQPAPVLASPAPAAAAPAVAAPAPAVEAPPKPAPAPERAQDAPRTAPRYDAAYLSNPRPPYPRLSQRRGEQGTVKLRVLVTKAGNAGKVELEKSSGFEALDESAMRTVATWKFEPARRGAEPLDEWFIVPIEFTLKSAGDAN